ncbi:hypothetical protein B0T11DRAFT_16491 [Plectosphaerella cucumerina]|uniref:Uncharacterized protein n=1 Tax=Plectosphaerella cucumerina TaxID=40658 RepID=A0A8K0TQ90_9PEZI|nr:hypothetical protein B0T11DRAFT_16491 [Plectosphaerella cucumerina]
MFHAPAVHRRQTESEGELGCQCQRLSLNISRSFLYNVGRPWRRGVGTPGGGQVTLRRAELVSRTMGRGLGDTGRQGSPGATGAGYVAGDFWEDKAAMDGTRPTGGQDRIGGQDRPGHQGQDRTGTGEGRWQAAGHDDDDDDDRGLTGTRDPRAFHDTTTTTRTSEASILPGSCSGHRTRGGRGPPDTISLCRVCSAHAWTTRVITALSAP